MNRVANPGVVRAVGIFMIILAILNLTPLALFYASGGEELIAEDEVGVYEPNTLNEIMQAVGSFTSPMGVMTIIHAPVLLAIGVALARLKRWEIFAVIALVIDMLVKVGAILSLLAIEKPSTALIPLAFIVVELAATAAMWQQWHERKREEERAPERVERPMYR